MRTGEYPEETLRPFRAIARRYLAAIWIAFSMTIIFFVLALSTSFTPEGQDASLWFQRSGSVTTIGALIIGIFAEKLKNRLRGQFMGDIFAMRVFEEVRFSFLIATVASFSLTIIGTLIWGYGDIFY
ncbi:hypothetical protein, partial [Pseudomonas viridiflava]|uniref:hypothetical protein n=1 Tax=Pseudomonas viridiflava TaxID=33069 RepID=UPI001980FEC2